MGYGTLKAGKKVAVASEDGSETVYEAYHVIIAMGADVLENFPSLPQDGKKVSYREAMTLLKNQKN